MEIAGKPKRIGLILSGGGARGFAHLGVLKVIEEAGIELDVVAGTSIGAVIGAFVCAGYSASEMIKIARKTSWRDVIDVSLQGGLVKGTRLHQFLGDYLPDSFAELNKPLVVATTDVETGEEVFILEGDLITAIRASSGYPGAIQPIQHLGRVLADGGIVNNLPVTAAAFLHASYTIASDVTPSRRDDYKDPKEGSWWERMVQTVRLERRQSIAQMLLRSTDIMQSILTEIQYNLHPTDVRVRMLMPNIRVESFWDLDAAIAIGEEEARKAFQAAGLYDETANDKKADDKRDNHKKAHDDDEKASTMKAKNSLANDQTAVSKQATLSDD